jgi:hypothetical protein
MASRLTEIVIESTDPVGAATFWSSALGWELREYQPGNVHWASASGDPEQHDLKLVFVKPRDPLNLSNRLYLNPSESEMPEEVKRLCDLGATLADPSSSVGEYPMVALIDPGGTGLTILATRVE